MVFGGRMDAAKRRTLEDGFVSALAAHGVHAVASYALFPELPSKVVARAAMQQDGADGYLVAVMRGKSEKTTFVPGYGFWGDFYGPNWGDEGGEPGYLVTNEFVNFWTSLWSSHGDGTLVWSAITETENPSSGMDFTASLLNKVIPALTQAGLITAEQMSVSYAPIPTAP